MKDRLIITIDRETHLKIREKMREGSFRNKSHLLEYAVLKLIDGDK
jgi:hypothetical protein